MNQKELKELIEFLIEKDISEFELERGDVKVRIKRGGHPASAPTVEYVPVAAPTAPAPSATPAQPPRAAAPPPATAPPPKVDDSTIMNPGIPDPGNGYGPSIATPPSPGSYYNYN